MELDGGHILAMFVVFILACFALGMIGLIIKHFFCEVTNLVRMVVNYRSNYESVTISDGGADDSTNSEGNISPKSQTTIRHEAERLIASSRGSPRSSKKKPGFSAHRYASLSKSVSLLPNLYTIPEEEPNVGKSHKKPPSRTDSTEKLLSASKDRVKHDHLK